jgi:hypothetical protein
MSDISIFALIEIYHVKHNFDTVTDITYNFILTFACDMCNILGNALMVGFTFTEALEALHFVEGFEETQLTIIPPIDLLADHDALFQHLQGFARQSFDVVVINQKLLHFDFERLQQALLTCLHYLKARTGMLIVNHMLVSRYFFDQLVPDAAAGTDAWKLLADVRQHDLFDAALANFDGGLLIICQRSNPILQSAQFFLERSERLLMLFLDRIIPVLSLPELHTWLSNSSGTKRYVRPFKNT